MKAQRAKLAVTVSVLRTQPMHWAMRHEHVVLAEGFASTRLGLGLALLRHMFLIRYGLGAAGRTARSLL